MIDQLTYFYAGERQGAALLIAFGVSSIIVAIFFHLGRNRYRSIGIPLVMVAIIQIFMGGSIYLRNSADQAAAIDLYDRDNKEFQVREGGRIAEQLAHYRLRRAVEISLLVLASGLMIYRRRHDLTMGFGIGLAIQSAIMLSLDIFAQARTLEYYAVLQAVAS